MGDIGPKTYDRVCELILRLKGNMLARIFGNEHQGTFQYILDNYYRLAWDRKQEFMGYEMEWDSPEYSRLYDSDFSFETGSAQKRLQQYQDICFAYDAIENSVDEALRPALFEMLGYSTHSAFQMNRKFLYAQANHETGNTTYAYPFNHRPWADSSKNNIPIEDVIDDRHR